MPRPTSQLGLPRRVVASYLLFCLVAVGLLCVGATLAVRALLATQATDGVLSRVGRLAAAVELDYVRSGGENWQALIERARSDARFAYAGVVGLDERFAAHTSPGLLGAPAAEPIGTALSWGAIDGVRFRDERDRLVSEYAATLNAGDLRIGALRVAVVEPGWGGVLAQFGSFAMLAVLGPLACVGVGALLLRRQIQPVAAVERVLAEVARTPRTETPAVARVAPDGLASVGWNRLVDEVLELRDGEAASDPLAKLAARAPSPEDRHARDAVDSLSEGIAVTDAEGRIEFANNALRALLGADDGEWSGGFVDTIAALSPPAGETLRSAARASTVVADAPVETPDGARTLRVERSPLAAGEGGRSGHVWAIRDVTQQKLVEASRDQFIDTATHELRTPLANIKAYAETLTTGALSDVEEQKEFCNTINTEATRLARFVDDLLSISSIETGSLGLNRQTVNVRRLVDEAAEKVRPLMRAKSLDFETKFAEKLGEASLDKDKIAGLLVNLLGNAAKYTPAGRSVTFTAVRKDQQLQLEVRDTGVGIAADEQDQVFEKFFRSANPDVRDQVGTGLGLPLAREIARLHRGDLTLKSELGEGSTFTVTLPTC